VRLSSPSEFFRTTGSAFAAPGAPPSPSSPAWGFSHRADSRHASVPRDPLLEFDSPSEFVRVFAARSPSPPRSPKRPERSVSAGSASQASCSHERTSPGAPFRLAGPKSRAADERLPIPSPVPSSGFLAPLDGSGCTSRRSESLARPAGGRDAPTFRGLIPCRSRPWSRPSELSPCRGAVPGFRPALASLRVRGRPLRGATCPSVFTIAFPVPPTLCRGSPSRARRTLGPGKTVPCDR
jgi:hypothetical protein